MKNAIILHGTCSKNEYYSGEYPSLSNSHWLPWLQKQLLIKGVHAVTPEMFEAYDPRYEAWKTEFEKNSINEDTLLVGHSCGGDFLVRYLSENKDTRAGKVVLVAPWLDPDCEKTNNFFEFVIDRDLASRTDGVTIFNSTDDDSDIQDSVKKIINEADDIELVEFDSYGHFCFKDMGTDAFPELLAKLF